MAIALAIDLGTTNLKLGLVDEQGTILYLRSVSVGVLNGDNGLAEHDPAALKKHITTLCQSIIQESGINEVDYIIASSYHFGLLLLDKQKKPLTGISVFTDTRAQSTFSEFITTYQNLDLYERTGCPLLTPYALPKLFYFLKKEPGIFQRAGFFVDSKAFLFEWLTGEMVTDVSTAAASQTLNLHTYNWDEELLAPLGLSRKHFPEVKEGNTHLAELKEDVRAAFGLKNKPKVVLGFYDGAALALALGALQPDIGIMNVGTSAMLRIPSPQPVFDLDDNKRIQPYALNKALFLNGGALNNAALPVNWLREKLFDVDLQSPDLLKAKSASPLFCLPYLTSERDSKVGPFATGVFFGLKQNHDKTDIARSVLEGVAYSMRYIFDALKENQSHIKELRMGGGGVHIKNWVQMFADVLGLPVTVAEGEQPALAGSAMIAFAAGGTKTDLTAVTKGVTIEPNSQALNRHNEHYAFFKKLRETLGPLYKAHAELS